jgi:hypothetical protein
MRRSGAQLRLRPAVEIVPPNDGFVPHLGFAGRNRASLALGLYS